MMKEGSREYKQERKLEREREKKARMLEDDILHPSYKQMMQNGSWFDEGVS